MRRRHHPWRSGQPACGNRRSGLTIYEVALAMAIFVMAMVTVSQLISTGSRASIDAQLHTEAALRAESKMAEVVSGYLPLAAVAGEADPNDARWLWSLNVADSPSATGLKELTVTATHLGDNGEADATYSMTRFMRDPQLYVDAALAEQEAASQAASKSSSSGSGGSGGTGGTATQGSGTSSSSKSSSSGSSSRSTGSSTGGGSSMSGKASSGSGSSSGAKSSSSKAKTP